MYTNFLATESKELEIDVAFLVNFTKNVDKKTIILVIFQVGQAKKLPLFWQMY